MNQKIQIHKKTGSWCNHKVTVKEELTGQLFLLSIFLLLTPELVGSVKEVTFGHGFALLSNLLFEKVNVKFSTARIEVHIFGSNNRRLVNNFVNNVKSKHNGNSKIRHEEVLRIRRATDGKERSPKGKAKHKGIEAKAKPRANEASLRFERNFVLVTALDVHGAAEPNMTETDRAPGKNRRETRESKQPVENIILLV